MALINCKECGKEISDKALQCPGCGCPNEEGKKNLPATAKQTAFLEDLGATEKQMDGLTVEKASALIDKLIAKRDRNQKRAKKEESNLLNKKFGCGQSCLILVGMFIGFILLVALLAQLEGL